MQKSQLNDPIDVIFDSIDQTNFIITVRQKYPDQFDDLVARQNQPCVAAEFDLPGFNTSLVN